jgi:3'-phosphoadenosine 5'-phosphosulfate sulfotransferase (PAPS reductase)/FAD synthetase
MTSQQPAADPRATLTASASDLSRIPREPVHVVALSGGKDSTALALRLAEVEPRDYVFICTPTGNETADMFAHWRRLADLLGKPLTPIVGGTLITMIRDYQALPNFRMRWCTRRLKIEPYAAWLARAAPAVSYVGLRADEPEREGGDYRAVPGITMRFPLREWNWTKRDVLAYLDARGVDIPPRTDCKLCFFQRLSEWYELWRTDPDGWAEGEALEASTGHTFRSDGRDAWPTAMVDLRARFESGDAPRGALQRDLFADLKCRVCRI